MDKRVLWHEQERVDEPDLSAMSALTEDETRRIVRLLAAPDLANLPSVATANGYLPYATLVASPDDIVYEPEVGYGSSITIKIGTSLVLAGALTGDVLAVEQDVVLEGYCPTEGIPTKLLMARVAATPTPTDEDTRVFYDDALDDEVEDLVPTRLAATIEWFAVDASVNQDILDAMAAGYSWVATMTRSAGPTFATTWHYVLPKTGTAASDPGFVSVVQALRAIWIQLARIVKTSPGSPPDALATPAISIQALKTWKDLVDVVMAAAQSDIGDIQTYLGEAKACSLTLVADHELPADNGIIEWDAEDFDSGNWHTAGAPTQIVLPATATYHVEVIVRLSDLPLIAMTGFVLVQVKHNGTVVEWLWRELTSQLVPMATDIRISGYITATAADYLEVVVESEIYTNVPEPVPITLDKESRFQVARVG